MTRGAVIFNRTADGDFEQSKMPNRYTREDWADQHVRKNDREQLLKFVIFDAVCVLFMGIIVLVLGGS